MWHAAEEVLHTLESIAHIIDVVLHWRFYVCFFAGLLGALLAYRLVPDPGVSTWLALAAGFVGLVVGAIWDWQSSD